jgi:hypothetical protein
MAEEDRWDDSAILAAFNRAVAAHDGDAPGAATGAYAARASGEAPDMRWQPVPPAAPAARAAPAGPAAPGGAPPAGPTSPGAAAPTGATAALPQPPLMVPAEQEELGNLLLAWYHAGYQMGRYEALQSRR